MTRKNAPADQAASELAATMTEPDHRQSGRFSPGRSGNPKGRPRKSTQVLTPIQSALNERVTITDSNGRRQTITAQEVIMKRLVQNAIKGDIHAIREVRTACPNLLTGLAVVDSKAATEALFRHLVREMSSPAVEELKAAMASWDVKRKELFGERAEASTTHTRRR